MLLVIVEKGKGKESRAINHKEWDEGKNGDV